MPIVTSDRFRNGILSSKLHRAWFEARATRMRRDLRCTPNTFFDSFPWPQAPTAHHIEALVDVVARCSTTATDGPPMACRSPDSTTRSVTPAATNCGRCTSSSTPLVGVLAEHERFALAW